MAENNRFGGIILEKYSKPNILFESQVAENKSIIPILGGPTLIAVAAAATKMMKADPLHEKRSVPLQKK